MDNTESSSRTHVNTNNPEAEITTPHTGSKHLPDDIRDLPAHEFENTTLEGFNAENPGQLSVPVSPDTLPGLMPPLEVIEEGERSPSVSEVAPPVPPITTTETDNAPERNPKSNKKTRNRLVGTALTLLLAAGGFFGVKAVVDSNNHADNVPKPDDKATSQTQTQSPAPETPSPQPSAVETIPTNNDPLPAELANIPSMTVEQFSALPLQTQLKYRSWATRNVRQFAQDFSTALGDPEANYPTKPLSLDSSPQDILTADYYNRLEALTQSDRDTGYKVNSANFVQGKESPTYHVLGDYIAQTSLYPMTAKGIASMPGLSGMNKVVSAKDIQSDTDGSKWREISWTASSYDLKGNLQTSTGTSLYRYVEYTDYKNQPAATWIVR